MATVYLGPNDFSDAQAKVILDYLNSTNSAEAMAARIEIENELDIGERLSSRIIRARDNLGGAFTELQQVYDIVYIGPERFTEIAVSLLDLQLPGSHVASNSNYDALLNQMARMQQELNLLRASLQDSGNKGSGSIQGSQRKVQLRVLQTDVFVGQHMTLDIYVFDARENKPLVDQSVTLSTNWGVLQYQQGYSWQQDAVVEVKTDIEGRAKVRLRSPTYENLTQEQQLALEAALQTLDASAATPAAIRTQLENLVLLYRNEHNRELRKAIDIYFNTQKIQIIESVNRRFFSDAWRFNNALISAYIHTADAGAELGNVRGQSNGYVESVSTVKVRLKDWVGAWYQTYLDYLENDNAFSARIIEVSANNGSGNNLMNGVLSEISRWALGERGIAGTIISEKSTEYAVQKFLADDIQVLPVQQQLQLFSALSLAVKPTAATQMGTLQAVADTQLTLADEFNGRLGTVEEISTLAANLEANISSFNTQFNTFQSGLSQFQISVATFNENLIDFNSSYTDFSVKYDIFDGQLVDFNTDFSAFEAQITTFNTELVATNAELADFKSDYSVFNSSYADYNASLGTFRSDIGELKLNVNRLDGQVSTLRRP